MSDESIIAANYFVDDEFRQTLKDIIDETPNDFWALLIITDPLETAKGRCTHVANGKSTFDRLVDPGEYGQEVPTDWYWCILCGVVTRDPDNLARGYRIPLNEYNKERPY